MAKLRFTGNADAPVTYQGKYEVTTGSVIEVDDSEANTLLQTGLFQAVDAGDSGSGSGDKPKSSASSKDTKGKS
jgi:hypothetical protein